LRGASSATAFRHSGNHPAGLKSNLQSGPWKRKNGGLESVFLALSSPPFGEDYRLLSAAVTSVAW
jgi:hypothetical protein